MEDKISLMDLIQQCFDFKESPWNEGLYTNIQDTIAKINFRERLSLAEKAVAAMSIVGKVDSLDLNPVECAFQIEIGLFFGGLCAYMVNVDTQLPPSMQTMEVYDLLSSLGLEERALEFCGKDFEKLRRMISDSVNFSNIFKLVNTAKEFSPEGIDKLAKVLKELKEELTPEKIREIRGLLTDADPAWKSLKETVGESIVGNQLLEASAALGQEPEQEKGHEAKAPADGTPTAEKAPLIKKPYKVGGDHE